MAAAALVPWVRAPDGVVLTVRLTPRGGRDAIEGIEMLADGQAVLKARVRAAPDKGAANAALLQLLASALGVGASQLSLAGGAAARVKRVKIAGDPARLAAVLVRIAAAQ